MVALNACGVQESKEWVRSSAYHPTTNGALARRHKKIAKLCRIYGTTPDKLPYDRFVANISKSNQLGNG